MATYITNPKQFNGMWAFIITIAIALIVVLTSCNPTRRVMQDPVKFDKVGNEWLRRQPKPDIAIPNDSIVWGKPDTAVQWFKVPDIKRSFFGSDSGFNYPIYLPEKRMDLDSAGWLNLDSSILQKMKAAGFTPPNDNAIPVKVITKPKIVYRVPDDIRRQIQLLSAKCDQQAKDHAAVIAKLNETIETLSGDLETMTNRRDKWRIWFFRLLAVNLVALLIWQRKRIRKIFA
jgi:hypothetical protein